MNRWFALIRSEELVPRHVASAQLLGQEIALWRSDAGGVNAWEDRCPHRGVRLTIGVNTGTELVCQYHGWRFAGTTGQCTFVPAHPGQRPAAALKATVYAVAERHGYVWVNLDPQAALVDLPGLDAGAALTLRSIFIDAPVDVVAAALARGYRVHPDVLAPVVANDAYTLTVTAPTAGAPHAMTFLLQPVNEGQSVIHGLLHGQAAGADRLATLRYHNAQLSALRRTVETGATRKLAS